MNNTYDWTPHLEEGEEVLWQGRPDGRYKLFLSLWDIFLVPFFTIWMLFSGLMTLFLLLGTVLSLVNSLAKAEPLALDAPLDLALFALIFPLVAYFAVGRQLLDRARRKRTRYAVTDRRALKVEVGHPKSLTVKTITPHVTVDVTLGKLTSIRLDPWGNASETKAASFVLSSDPFGMRKRLFQGYVEEGFEMRLLPDGREVAKLLRELKSQAAEATP